jgi:signal transduction histidine kinase
MGTESQDAKNRLILRQMTRLVEISIQLNSTLDPDQLLAFIMETAAELLECEAASILLYDEKRGDLSFISAAGSDSQKMAQIPVPLDGSIAGMIYTTNQPMVINHADEDPRHYAQVGAQLNFQTRKLIGVPMRIRERVMGVLEAINKRTGDFNQGDVDLLFIIADQAAVAIHNAQLLQQLQTTYNELSRVDKIKSDFIAVASHELRTPLGVILGYAGFLTEEAQGEQSEHAHHVLKAAIQLRGLVQAMTNMNMLQIGSLELRKTELNLQEVIQTACEDESVSLLEKSHILKLQMPAEPVFVMGDGEKLKRVLTNVIDNAVRFTPERGRITITLSSSNSQAHIHVIDNGTGIAEPELENIFKQFYQVESHMTRHHGGLGLGLAIARGLVELHGGKIWAESAGAGMGTTVKISLPLKKTS